MLILPSGCDLNTPPIDALLFGMNPLYGRKNFYVYSGIFVKTAVDWIIGVLLPSSTIESAKLFFISRSFLPFCARNLLALVPWTTVTAGFLSNFSGI